MKKYLQIVSCAVLVIAIGLSAGCGGSSGGGGGSLSGSWKWIESTWSGASGLAVTFTDSQLKAWGASLNITIKAKSDGTITADVIADDVSGGDVEDALVGTWRADDNNITITTTDGTITIPYSLEGNKLTVTASTAQILAITGEALPSAYSYLKNATADAVFKKQ